MPGSVVITGAASGIGRGLAEVFLKRGWQVTLADRNESALNAASEAISIVSGCRERLHCVVCDVTVLHDIETLWDLAKARWHHIDIWINNAGVSAPIKNIVDTETDVLNRVIDVNVKGVVQGSQVASQHMQKQGSGFIYNISGFGGEGTMRPGMVIYGTSKRAVAYFSKAMAKESAQANVKIGWINPGMVITPMVVEDAKKMPAEKWKEGRRVFNWFGETIETTTERLVDEIEANQSNGKHIHLLPLWKIIWRIISSPFTRRDILRQFGI